MKPHIHKQYGVKYGKRPARLIGLSCKIHRSGNCSSNKSSTPMDPGIGVLSWYNKMLGMYCDYGMSKRLISSVIYIVAVIFFQLRRRASVFVDHDSTLNNLFQWIPLTWNHFTMILFATYSTILCILHFSQFTYISSCFTSK